MTDRLVYRTDEVAADAGISERHVLRLIAAGDLVPVRVRGSVRISRKDRDRLVASPPPEPDDDLLRVGEAAAMLGVSARTAWRMIEAGELPTVKLGPRATRVRMSDVQELVA
jgi:excisionase family DNA binding protein